MLHFSLLRKYQYGKNGSLMQLLEIIIRKTLKKVSQSRKKLINTIFGFLCIYEKKQKGNTESEFIQMFSYLVIFSP